MTAKKLPKKAILVANTKSRRGREGFDEAVRLLKQSGIDLIEKHPITDPKKLSPIVKKAVETAPMVIVGGGDGTLSSAIDAFKDSDTIFALLPLGTANSFARALQIPLDLPSAIEVIAKGEQRRIDLGCIDGDYFGNSAMIGLSPQIAKTVPHKLKGILGRAGYAIWALRVAARFRPFKLTVREDGNSTELWASEVRIANGGFFGGVELVEDANLQSGRIVVEVVATKTRRHLLASWVSSALRLRSRKEGVVEFRARKVRLETDPPMDVSIDGELSAKTPTEVWIAPKAVTIAAPASRRG